MRHQVISSTMAHRHKDRLTAKEEAFSQTYVKKGDIKGNASASYRDCYDCRRMTVATINRRASEILNKPLVAARIAELQKEIWDSTKIEASQILRQWWDIIQADPNELTQHRRECCRYCYGVDHKYQWTEMEYAKSCAEAVHFAKRDEVPKMPDASGGFNFNPHRDPHPACPECHGNGIGNLHIADTRKLTGAARALYAGVRYRRDGIEILFADKERARENLAKWMGMFKDKLSTPAGSNPSEPMRSVSQITTDPVEASKLYQQFIGS